MEDARISFDKQHGNRARLGGEPATLVTTVEDRSRGASCLVGEGERVSTRAKGASLL